MLVTIRRATLSFLRVCINLTNSNGETCEALNDGTDITKVLVDVITKHPERYYDKDYEKDSNSIKSSDDDNELRESRFELLLLGLGLMINLVQESNYLKKTVQSNYGEEVEKIFETLITHDVYSL